MQRVGGCDTTLPSARALQENEMELCSKHHGEVCFDDGESCPACIATGDLEAAAIEWGKERMGDAASTSGECAMREQGKDLLEVIKGREVSGLDTSDRCFIDRCSILLIDPNWQPTSHGIERLKSIAVAQDVTIRAISMRTIGSILQEVASGSCTCLSGPKDIDGYRKKCLPCRASCSFENDLRVFDLANVHNVR